MHIQSLPMWVGSSNNYAYLISDAASREAVVVDPANPSEVTPTLQSQVSSGQISKLNAIINTHHHWDHAGGNKEILSRFPSTPIIGGKDCEGVTETPAHGSKFKIGKNIEVTALHTPCHTLDSICYYMEDKTAAAEVLQQTADGQTPSPSMSPSVSRAVFTGDTLFIGGCGKFFEGTAAQMNTALNITLAALPDDTKVFPGHEYTKSNVRFLETVTGGGGGGGADDAVQELKRFAAENAQTQGKFTIADEKRHNVFMRVGTEEMKRVTGRTEDSEVLARLREMKNNM